MSDGTLRIRIGASLDRSVDVVFSQMEKRGERAAKTIETQLRRIGANRGPYRTATAEAEKHFKSVERLADQASRSSVSAEERAFRQKIRMQNRYFAEKQRAEERAEKKIAQLREREIDRFATRTSQRSTRFMFGAPEGAFRYGTRVGSDILRGAGIDFNVGASVQRSVGLQTLALQTLQSVPKGQKVTAAQLQKETFAIAQKESEDPEKVAQALKTFASVTGDLDMGRKTLVDIVKLSGATGANIEDVSKAAAEMSDRFGDVPNKAEAIANAMRIVAAQGKLGAAPMAEMAAAMPKLATVAGMIEGGAAKNLTRVTAMAEITRQTGGASTIREATNAVARLQGSMTNRAAVFHKAGIETLNAAGKGRDPIRIIEEALLSTGAGKSAKGTMAFNKLFTGVMPQKTIAAYVSTYAGAGGGKAGIKAIDDLMAKFEGAAMSAEEVEKADKERQATQAAKAQRFQNSLDAIVEDVSGKLLPAFDRAEPKILNLAQAAGDVASFLANHLGAAIVVAVSGSIARAGLESTFRAGLEKAIKFGFEKTGAAPTSGLGGVGGLGGVLTLAAIAVTSFTVTKMVVEELLSKEDAANKEAVEKDVATFNELNAVRSHASHGGSLTAADLENLKKRGDELTHRISGAEVLKAHGGPGNVERLAALVGGRYGEYQQNASDLKHIEELKAQQAQIVTWLAKVATGTLKVDVVSQPPAPPGVDPRGRQPGAAPPP